MIVKTENLSREFVRGKNQFYAVDHVNLEVEEKELVAIMGQSGSGKSTLMNIIGALDVPTSGSYLLGGEDVDQTDSYRFCGEATLVISCRDKIFSRI